MNVNYECQNCGSTEILKEAYAMWDTTAQEWVIHSTYEEFTCNVCGSRSGDILEVEAI